MEIPFDVYPHDAIMPLPLEEADVVVGDLPVGYYPVDERSKEMKLGFEDGHSYSHYLLLEQAVNAVRPGGYVFLIVAINFWSCFTSSPSNNWLGTIKNT